MASLADNLMDDAFANGTLPTFGESIKIITGPETGNVYQCAILPADPALFQGEETQDPREKSIAYFPNNTWPKNAKNQDRMTDSSGNTWKLTKRINNPSDNSVDFDCVLVVPGKDN